MLDLLTPHRHCEGTNEILTESIQMLEITTLQLLKHKRQQESPGLSWECKAFPIPILIRKYNWKKGSYNLLLN